MYLNINLWLLLWIRCLFYLPSLTNGEGSMFRGVFEYTIACKAKFRSNCSCNKRFTA